MVFGGLGPSDVISLIQDAGSTALGLPTLTHLIFGFIVFIAVILVWIGTSMVLSQLIVGNTSPRSGYGSGGMMAVIGLIAIGSIHLYRIL